MVCRILFSPRVLLWTTGAPSVTVQSPRRIRANVTIATDPAWGNWTLVLSVLAGVSMTFDNLLYYVDGVTRDKLEHGL